MATGTRQARSEEHTSELQSRTLNSYAVFCLKKKMMDASLAVEAGGLVVVVGPNGAGKTTLINALAWLFFFNDTTTTKIYTSVHTLSLHDALPISRVALERNANSSLARAQTEHPA